MAVVRQLGLILGASVLLATAAMPLAQAGVTCSAFPDWCPPGITKVGPPPPPPGDHSTPEPGALGLLALGAGAAIYRMRRRGK
jgi:PEP-CTERM motif